MNQYILHHHLVKLKGYEIGVFDGKSYMLAIPFVDYSFFKNLEDGKLLCVDIIKTTPESGYFDFKKHESIIELPDDWDYFNCGSSNDVYKNEFKVKPLIIGYKDIIKASDNKLILNSFKKFGRDYILNIDELLSDLGMTSLVKYQFRKHRDYCYDDVDYGYMIVYFVDHPNTKVCIDSHGYADGHIAVADFESYEKIKKKLLKLKEWIENE